MAWYVGDIISEIFSTSVPGESFSRSASYIDNVAVAWNPTFIDLGGGYYRYTYTALQVGAHEWIGSGSSTGPIAINVDVDETPTAIEEVVVVTTVAAPSAASTARDADRLPVIFHLTGQDAILQGADWSWPISIEEPTLPAPPFQPGSPYAVGEYLVPTEGNETGFRYLVVTAGTAAGTEPTWPTVKGGRVVSGSVGFMAVGEWRLRDTHAGSARMHVKDEYGGTAYVVASEGTGSISLGYDPPLWTASTAYTLGQRVLSHTANGWVYECVDAGTSAASAPAFPTGLGEIVVDGGVVWRNVMDDVSGGATNLRIQLSAGQTAALQNWGCGLYDLEYYGAFGFTERLYSGNAELWQEVTATA